MTTQNRSTVVAAIVNEAEVNVTYKAKNGIVSTRRFQPTGLEKCKNGNTIVRGYCPHQEAPRSLSLDGIRTVI